jgi:hypothetical protein
LHIEGGLQVGWLGSWQDATVPAWQSQVPSLQLAQVQVLSQVTPGAQSTQRPPEATPVEQGVAPGQVA